MDIGKQPPGENLEAVYRSEIDHELHAHGLEKAIARAKKNAAHASAIYAVLLRVQDLKTGAPPKARAPQ
jgi:hypothetical protein